MLTPEEIHAALTPPFYGGVGRVLTLDQVRRVLGAGRTHKEQPLSHLLRMAHPDAIGNEHARQVLANTDYAIRGIVGFGDGGLRAWLDRRIGDCCAVRDFENVSSALGEIRCAGYLAQVGLVPTAIRTGKEKTPDFRIDHGGEPVYVEVFTKNMHGEEAGKLKAFLRERHPSPQNGGVTVREHVVRPAGMPKDNETVVENLAQKFAGKKPRGEQVGSGDAAILWMDVQDEDWWSLSGRDAEPVWVGPDAQFFTSGLWHAIYGTKGTPMLEGHSPAHRPRGDFVQMGFDGMFAQHDRWSAAVLSFPRTTIVFENPTARRPLPLEMLTRLLSLRWFDWSRSRLAWPDSRWVRIAPEHVRRRVSRLLLRLRIRAERALLRDLALAARGNW